MAFGTLGGLVLSRKRDESIMIGDDVRVSVVDIRGDRVRLSISAPTAVPVHRREVYDAIRRDRDVDRLDESKEDEQ